MRAKQFCVLTTTESRANIWCRWDAFKSPVALAAVRSKSVVLLLLIRCLVCFPLVIRVLCLSLFCCALLCVLSSFAIILKRKRELVSLLLLSCGRLVAVDVLRLFLTVPLVGLRCVIVVFPDHTHLHFAKCLS